MRISPSAFRDSRMHVKNALTRSSHAFSRNARWKVAHSKSTTKTLTAEKLLENLWSSKNLGALRASCSALAKKSENLAAIRASCSASAKKSENGDVKLLSNYSATQQRIRDVIAPLIESGKEKDMHHIETVLRDIYPLLGLSPTRPDYMFAFQGLLDRGYCRQAFGILLAMKNLPGNFTPETTHFRKLLVQWSKTASFATLQRCVGLFYDVNPKLPNDAFLLLLNVRFTTAALEDTPLDFNEISALVRWCVNKGMPSDPVISSTLYHAFANAGDFDGAKHIVAVYESASRPDADFDDRASSPPLATSSLAAQALVMLANATSYADMLAVSESLDISCEAQHYAVVIANCISSGKDEDAFDVYSRSIQAGVIPTATMVSPLIKSLYLGNYLDSSDDAIDKALEIYRHLADAWPHAKGYGPTEKLYIALIRMALSSNTTRYLSTTQSLLADMELRGYTYNSSFIAATRIIIEMRKAGNFSHVMDFYREHRGKLKEQGFTQILQEYCRISFSGDLELPLITEYFSIINHMRMQNIPLTPKVYTIILHQIGLIATNVRNSRLDPSLPNASIYQRLVDTTRRIHHFLALDASISPDAILWNQLMNTYQRLGLYRDMGKLWQMMYLSGRFDQITVNIMIDACGFSGDLRFVRSIIAKLLNAGHRLDGRNWDTLVEALCRNHHFGQALEVICVEMKKYELEPRVRTIRIFRKFGRRDGVWLLYQPSIASAYPKLWQSFPNQFKKT